MPFRMVRVQDRCVEKFHLNCCFQPPPIPGLPPSLSPPPMLRTPSAPRSLHPSRLIIFLVLPLFQTIQLLLRYFCLQHDLIKHHLQMQLLCHLSSPLLTFIPSKTRPSTGSRAGRCTRRAPELASLCSQLKPPRKISETWDKMLSVLPAFIHQSLPPERVRCPLKH